MGVESNGQNGHANGLVQSGGGPSTLDASNERDRGLLRTAMTWWPARWRGLTPEFKDEIARQLQRALDEADRVADDDPAEAARIRASVSKTAALMEGQQQKDQHLAVDIAFGRSKSPEVNVNVAVPIKVEFDRGGVCAWWVPLAISGVAVCLWFLL